MYYIIESDKSFEQASADLEAAVKRQQFGVLHVHNLGATLRGKGLAFENECKVFEVCNPGQAARVMAIDMRLNMALPCRISVYTEAGRTKLGMIEPVKMLTALSVDPELAGIAAEVETQIRVMMDEAA